MMLVAEWIAAVRLLLLVEPEPDEPWTDSDMLRYYDEGLSPQLATTELAFRDLARN